jgi:hypothetical protein
MICFGRHAALMSGASPSGAAEGRLLFNELLFSSVHPKSAWPMSEIGETNRLSDTGAASLAAQH